MQYEGFVQACRALGIRAQHFRDREHLAHALEQSVDAGNASTIVRLLRQMTEDDFDLGEAGRVFKRPRLEVAWTIQPWAPLELDECALRCGCGTPTDPLHTLEALDRVRAWIGAMPQKMKRAILSFFAAPESRFLLVEELGAVRLSVRDARLESSYTLPARFDLDPRRATATGAELLRHLRIGMLYHAILATAHEMEAERMLALLAGESLSLRPSL